MVVAVEVGVVPVLIGGRPLRCISTRAVQYILDLYGMLFEVFPILKKGLNGPKKATDYFGNGWEVMKMWS